ncbi:MAG: hypothetical protein OXI77_04790 [Chloroflexota bacterium]|nr:hypothetical protein [Chloroflexota bacterium]MDE2907738.1 hypothetical protein [Chloroflexota bacterium]
MPRIAVSANSLVDYSPDRWRLIQVYEADAPKLIVEAKTGLPFRYNGYFAVSRDLPETGEIQLADLGQVVLGRSNETSSWQLGLTLSPELSLARSSRWFELLRFTNPDADAQEGTAAQLGAALADTLGIPFSSPSPVTMAPEPEPIPLEPLPLDLGLWRLEEAPQMHGGDGELRLIREKRWLRAKQRQIAWYCVLTLVYLWVSIATLTSELGLPIAGTLIPNPAWLPYLGIVVAVLLLLAIGRLLLIILRQPNTIVINQYEKTVSASRGDRPLWKVNAGGVQSIYVSEVVKKRGRRPTVLHGEINLHLLDGRFMPILIDHEKIVDALLPGRDPVTEKERPADVHVLEPEAVSTALQAAAIHISVRLGELPVWYDRRLK